MTHHDKSTLDALAMNYGLSPPLEPFELAEQGVNNTTRGLRTGRGDLIWKTYTTQRNADALLYEHRLLEWLGGQGLPYSVPAPLLTHAGATALFSASHWHVLFPRLPGHPPDRRDARHAAALGAALARRHGALSGYSIASRPGMASYGDLARS